jgi:hypothetical protein
MSMKLFTPFQWNQLSKPSEAYIEADWNCICAKINNLYCYCNTTNSSNVIVIFSDKYNISNIRSLYKFLVYLYNININYITVSCKPERYKIMQHIFRDYCADAGIEKGRNYQMLYFHLCSESVKLLKRLSSE